MPIIGGVLIGLAAVWLFLSIGRISGISGIASNVVFNAKENIWTVLFVLGLGIGGWLAYAVIGMAARPELEVNGIIMLVVGGILVGFGTRLGSGCTSGHGVCGISRFSLRSLVATIAFLVVGMVVATAISLI